jgi:hypothetical protein
LLPICQRGEFSLHSSILCHLGCWAVGFLHF